MKHNVVIETLANNIATVCGALNLQKKLGNWKGLNGHDFIADVFAFEVGKIARIALTKSNRSY